MLWSVCFLLNHGGIEGKKGPLPVQEGKMRKGEMDGNVSRLVNCIILHRGEMDIVKVLIYNPLRISLPP